MRFRMITVTSTAKEKIEEIMAKKGADPEKTIRVTTSSSNENDLEFIWDKERKGDYVIKNENERTLLAIKANLAKSLDGMALDYLDTPKVFGFTVKKITPGL